MTVAIRMSASSGQPWSTTTSVTTLPTTSDNVRIARAPSATEIGKLGWASRGWAAGAIGDVLGMILGAIGGAMVPSELFEEPMSTVSRLTPHAPGP